MAHEAESLQPLQKRLPIAWLQSYVDQTMHDATLNFITCSKNRLKFIIWSLKYSFSAFYDYPNPIFLTGGILSYYLIDFFRTRASPCDFCFYTFEKISKRAIFSHWRYWDTLCEEYSTPHSHYFWNQILASEFHPQ